MYKSMNKKIRKIVENFDEKINSLQEHFSGSKIKDKET